MYIKKLVLIVLTCGLSILIFSGISFADIKEDWLNAAQNGHLDVVKALLVKGVNVNMKNEKGVTALMFATQNGHTEIVKELIANDADVNMKSGHGWTALMFAAQNGHTETVRVLLDNKANVNVKSKDKHGWTALMSASGNGHTEIVKILLDNNADINMKDKMGRSALTIAEIFSKENKEDTVKLLTQYKTKGIKQTRNDIANSSAIESRANQAQLHFNKGVILLGEENLNSAFKEFEQIVRIDDSNTSGLIAEAYNNMGNILLKQSNGLSKDAISFYEKAIKVDSTMIAAYINLGKLYTNIGIADKDMKSFKNALKIFESANKLSQNEKIDDKLIKVLNEELVRAHLNLALNYVEADNSQEAIKEFKEVISLDPQNLQAHANLGFEYEKLGKHREAIYHTKKAIELPDSEKVGIKIDLIRFYNTILEQYE